MQRGKLVLYPILDSGELGEAIASYGYKGSGPNLARQTKPHAHFVQTWKGLIFGADLGTDQVWITRLNTQEGCFQRHEPPSIKIEPGSGPRHLAFHPNGRFFYISNELNSTITAVVYQGGYFKKIETQPSLPNNYQGENTGAHLVVHPMGNFLYAANRGHNSLAIFKIGVDGNLTLLGHKSTGGENPRHFTLDPSGKFLLVANQTSGNVASFHVDLTSGLLSATGYSIEMPAPVCLAFP